MTVSLTDEQEAAVAIALGVAKNGGHMSLMGPAGTGKTTTIRVIAERVIAASKGKGVLLVAPTHKARRQFAAAALPWGTRTMTIHKLCKVQPDQWRDQERFRLSSKSDLSTIDNLRKTFALVIVDESSMVKQELAAKVVDLCDQAGVGVIFAGDPYQLPPVSDRKGHDEDGPDAEPSGDEQAPQFTDAPVVARLTRVMRHGGPILDFATSMRESWQRLHGFPAVSNYDQSSMIEVLEDTQSAFIEHFTAVYGQLQSGAISESEFFRVSPRALCYKNQTVNNLTRRLRTDIYGPRALEGWQQREIILFPSLARTLGGQFIHSSTDAIILSSRIVEIDRSARPVHWKTPKRGLERTCELRFSGRFQELTVHIVRADGTVDESREHVVYTPLLGDKSVRECYTKLRASVERIEPRLDSQHYAWQWLKSIRDTFFTPVTSAFVLTVHKSQGSTFDHVYVERDLLVKEDPAERNPLLYVAATRAAKSITFGAAHAVGA